MATDGTLAMPGPAGMGAFACVLRAWDAHEDELRGFLRNQLRDTQTAEDVLQDTFLKAMREGQGFCALDNPRAWLFRVARNAATDRLRLGKPHEPIDAQAETLAQPASDEAEPVDALAPCLERVMSELSHEDAEVLRACDIEGRTQKAFAQAQNLSLPAVKSRLLRARQRLRERLTTACRVQFDPDDGSVSGFLGRAVQESK